MAKITIVIEDTIENGQPTATADFQIDPEGAPPTVALLFAVAFQRLWRSRTWSGLASVICDDMIDLRREVV